MNKTPLPHPPIATPLRDVKTERLDLRRLQIGDLDALAPVFAKQEVWHFPYGRGFTRDETMQFLARQSAEWEACGFGLWLAIERSADRVLGYVGLSVPHFFPEILPAVEVGWRFDPQAWGRGYATEAARAALDEAFCTLELNEVCSLPQVENPRSGKVCQRLGMHWDRDVVIPANDRRGAVSAHLYTITRNAWLGRT